MSRAPVYPRGLQARGRRLWREVLETRPRLGPGERVLLEEACRLADRLDLLNDAIVGNRLPVLTDPDGTEFTIVIDGAQSEARQTTVVLRQTLTALGLDRLPATVAPVKPAAEEKVKAAGPKDPLDEITAARRKREGTGA